MNVRFINPFIEGVNDLFGTMLSAGIRRGEPVVSKEAPGHLDVVAMIGISGEVQGSVALGMPAQTAMKMTSALLGMTIEELDSTTTDGIAELVNIIAGSAKAKLGETSSEPLQLSLPNVVRGKELTIGCPSQAIWLDIPYETDFGPFNLCVSLKNA
jgi:chemotaxis protein CheX